MYEKLPNEFTKTLNNYVFVSKNDLTLSMLDKISADEILK